MSELAALQARFHAIATGRAPLASAATLVRDDGVAPADRMHVYAHAYFVRIRDAIAEEYPKVAAALGAEPFTRLVAAYLEVHPTRHPSLREAGVALSGFLAAGGWPAGPGWLADLAALERARTEAFDGADATPLRAADLAELPPDGFAQLRLRLVPTAALLAIGHNADDAWAALEDDAPPPAAVERPRTVVVWRRDVMVIHRTLAGDEALALRRIRDGALFAEVCDGLADHPDPAARAIELLTAWLAAELLTT